MNTLNLCDCGHDVFDHASDPTHSGNTPCAGYRNLNEHGQPLDYCTCREWQPALRAVTLVWEESTNLRDEDDWTSGEVTTYTVRLYNGTPSDGDEEIDSDGFTADEADETDPQPYTDAENRLLARYEIDRSKVIDVVTPF